jgi:8-oxo-dGTP diphosphatase
MNYDIFQDDACQAQSNARSFSACPGFHLFIISIVQVKCLSTQARKGYILILQKRTLKNKKSYPRYPMVAVGAVVFKNNCVLLVRRGQPPSEDQWAIPGGSVEIGETLQEAAEREILEETGIKIRAGKPIYTFDVIDRDEEGKIRFHYVIIDLAADYVSGKPAADDDAAEARWVSAHEVNELAVSAPTLNLLKAKFGFGK